MTPEAAGYLDKARQCLAYARTNLDVNLSNDAGRNAYLAAFHAAQAYIFAKTQTVAKSHHGVHTAFNKLAQDDLRIGREQRRFLSQAYNLKAIADYEMGPDSVVPLPRAQAALVDAVRFVEVIAQTLEGEGG